MSEIPRFRKTVATGLLASVALTACSSRSVNVQGVAAAKGDGCVSWQFPLNSTVQADILALHHWPDEVPELTLQVPIIEVDVTAPNFSNPIQNSPNFINDMTLAGYLAAKHNQGHSAINVQTIDNPQLPQEEIQLEAFDISCVGYLASRTMPKHNG